jgi:hypothetical protein
MTLERMHFSLIENRISQTAWAVLSGVDTGTVSRALRGLAVISEGEKEKLEFGLSAMLELQDESATPIDWRQAAKLKPLIDQKIASYRAARSRELHRQFTESQATA